MSWQAGLLANMVGKANKGFLQSRTFFLGAGTRYATQDPIGNTGRPSNTALASTNHKTI